jgi:hypothetical protein
MDFIALLIIGLWIIFTTWKMKIEKKWGLLFTFLIYLSLLLYTVWVNIYFYILHNQDFELPGAYIDNNVNYWVLSIFYLEFFFIFYFLLYFLIFPFQDKKINLKKKLYFLFRDFIILFSVFCFFWVYNDIVWKYMKYHERYLNEENFWGEEFICMDNSATLLLERNYRHEVIVNPYKNFFEFYKNYWIPQKSWIILTNKLQKKLVTKTFLITCRNNNWENYYEKYIKIHGKKPYFKYIEYKINYKYFLDDSQVEIILEKLKNREYYIDNLIEYSYKEFDLWMTVQELDEYSPWNNVYDIIEEKRSLAFEKTDLWSKYKYFEMFQEIPWYNIKGKWDIEYKWEDFWIPEWFYEEMLKKSEGWITFYKHQDKTYTVNKSSIYEWQDLIFRNNNLFQWVNWAFSNIRQIWEKFTFEFTYFDTENNQEFQEKKCEVILDLWKESYWKCYIRYNEDQSTEFVCRDEKLLLKDDFITKYQEYKKCNNLKNKSITTNISLAWELLNQKHDILESKNIFEYNDKIWFIARSSEWYFIMFNWVQVSKNFDYLRIKSCCMIQRFPFNIYENWVLEYVFSREKKLYVWFIELNIK